MGGHHVLFRLNGEGIVTAVSGSLERATGWPQDHWVGSHWTTLVHEDDLSKARATFEQTLRGDRPGPVELRIRSRERAASASWSALPPRRSKAGR
jgi:PAS domain S-box-containing protein